MHVCVSRVLVRADACPGRRALALFSGPRSGDSHPTGTDSREGELQGLHLHRPLQGPPLNFMFFLLKWTQLEKCQSHTPWIGSSPILQWRKLRRRGAQPQKGLRARDSYASNHPPLPGWARLLTAATQASFSWGHMRPGSTRPPPWGLLSPTTGPSLPQWLRCWALPGNGPPAPQAPPPMSHPGYSLAHQCPLALCPILLVTPPRRA